MSITIRVDIDQPYGWQNKIKIILNYISIKTPFIIRLPLFGYLKHLSNFLKYCNNNNISCKLFFRRCTIPTKKIKKLIKDGNHEIGWHVESCKTFDDFKKEYMYMSKKLNQPIKIYSKHGSGKIHNNRIVSHKIGYYHYPEYELNNLLEFGNKLKLKEFYGNGECPEKCNLNKYKNINYYTDAFWMHESYRNTDKYTIDWLIENIKNKNIIILIHPFNYIIHEQVNKDFKKIIKRIQL
jgi:hypothetical protein